MTKPRLLIADDHKIFTEGLKRLLNADFDIAGVVEDGRELVAAAEKLRPDLIVADISMPMLNGIEAVRQIKKVHPETKVVFLTMHPDVAYAVSAFKEGAAGYVLKNSAPDELITAIREGLKGRTYVTPLIAGKLLNSYQSGCQSGADTVICLSSRQREVLQLLAESHSVKEIAAILNISTKTVEYHKYRMMEDLGIKSAAELIRYAVKQGITEP
ncbi:MAG: response regulator transcription factor [Deltaproteobacteria bacterium]|nr:response regulator transcription factor [Deltaproteobacteria bacterium]